MGTPAERLVISIDLGTTQSAVGVYYTYQLKKADGSVERKILVDSVAGWPGQMSSMHLARVPTTVLYNHRNQLVACGAEAVEQHSELNDEDVEGGMRYAACFKMDVHSSEKPVEKDASLMRTYIDYLEYLVRHTRNWMRSTWGHDPWSSFRNTVEIVMSHPNDWGQKQQTFLQSAVIKAGLISAEGAETRLHFMEEAEASMAFAVFSESTLNACLESGFEFIVCDAGGSTVDISTYRVKSSTPQCITLKELQVPSSLRVGGVHVDRRFGESLIDLLLSRDGIPALGGDDDEVRSQFEDCLEEGMNAFESSEKKKFSGVDTPIHISLGDRSMVLPGIGVMKGMMLIEGKETATYFDPSVIAMLNVISTIITRKARNISCIVLTGAFSNSPYLQQRIRAEYENESRRVIVTNSANCKAVAVGAILPFVEGKKAIVVEREPRPWPLRLISLGLNRRKDLKVKSPKPTHQA